MPAPYDNIVQHLFHQPSLQSVTVDELERMARQHPYFAAAHFLLLKKMQDSRHPGFTDQLHKTTLYFNNPLWLQFLLQPDSVTGFTVSDQSPFLINEQPAGDHEDHSDRGLSGMEALPAAAVIDPENDKDEAGTVAVDQEAAAFSDGEPAGSRLEELPQPAERNEPPAIAVQEETVGEPSYPATANGEETPAPADDNGNGRYTAAMPDATPETPPPLFEPYHTIDYFASQGIKLSTAEADGKDKLGKKLRSFTEWLKTMKKLPPASIDNMLAENEESKVVEDASHSIENKDVITEAMAEVFEKQGMYEKATDIYRKLSLHNPSKSAYFAARIEALKH